MSAIVSAHVPLATGALSVKAATRVEKCGREEEFRSALDRYIADYADEQRRRANPVPARYRDRIVAKAAELLEVRPAQVHRVRGASVTI